MTLVVVVGFCGSDDLLRPSPADFAAVVLRPADSLQRPRTCTVLLLVFTDCLLLWCSSDAPEIIGLFAASVCSYGQNQAFTLCNQIIWASHWLCVHPQRSKVKYV